jgi:peptidyl-prolyl cis-trans isomerase SurA
MKHLQSQLSLRFLVLSFLLLTFLAPAQITTRNEEEAKLLSDSIYNLILKGEDFTKLAARYSEDGTKDKGGMIVNCRKGQFVPEFEDAVLKLDVGGVSPPFKTQFGYHVAQLMTRNGETFSVRHILIRFRE